MKKSILLIATLFAVCNTEAIAKNSKELNDDLKTIKGWVKEYDDLNQKRTRGEPSEYVVGRWKALDTIANKLMDDILGTCGSQQNPNMRTVVVPDTVTTSCEEAIVKASEFRFIVRESNELIKDPKQSPPPMDLSKSYDRTLTQSQEEEEILGKAVQAEPKKEEVIVTLPAGESK